MRARARGGAHEGFGARISTKLAEVRVVNAPSRFANYGRGSETLSRRDHRDRSNGRAWYTWGEASSRSVHRGRGHVRIR